MMSHDWSNGIGKVNATENLRADRGMDFHLFKLDGSQASGFVDNVRGHCKFSDVVKQRPCSGEVNAAKFFRLACFSVESRPDKIDDLRAGEDRYSQQS